ncbi:hypothetical protein BH708_12890 [Brachybacterium sp. P6-10-X1]|nr:hypothetical protein BH708_12890 [Brachybacterium sp. P6-10-X1]
MTPGSASAVRRREPLADDPDHAFLHRIIDDHRTNHVHVVPGDSVTFTDYLLFRDFLRTVPDGVMVAFEVGSPCR